MEKLKELEKENLQINLIETQKKIEKIKKINKKDINNILNEISLFNNNSNNNNTNNNIKDNKLLKNIKIYPLIESGINFNNILKCNDKKKLDNILIKSKELYKNITGLNFNYLDKSILKIEFSFIKKDNYYIELCLEYGKYSIIDSSPKNINYKKYLDEFNNTNDFCLFICKIINFELFPIVNIK